MSPFCVFFLLILVSSLPGDPQALDCDSCMCTTQVGSVLPKLWCSTLIILVQAQLLGHAPTTIPTYPVCSRYGQFICFNPIYHPWKQWLEAQNFTSTGELISQTQVYNPKKPISICFDVCTIIAKNTIYQPQGNRNTCRSLAWEKAYMSNDKYM
jgi:hypothetical protein